MCPPLKSTLSLRDRCTPPSPHWPQLPEMISCSLPPPQAVVQSRCTTRCEPTGWQQITHFSIYCCPWACISRCGRCAPVWPQRWAMAHMFQPVRVCAQNMPNHSFLNLLRPHTANRRRSNIRGWRRSSEALHSCAQDVVVLSRCISASSPAPCLKLSGCFRFCSTSTTGF